MPLEVQERTKLSRATTISCPIALPKNAPSAKLKVYTPTVWELLLAKQYTADNINWRL
jgi:hypothetical protein